MGYLGGRQYCTGSGRSRCVCSLQSHVGGIEQPGPLAFVPRRISLKARLSQGSACRASLFNNSARCRVVVLERRQVPVPAGHLAVRLWPSRCSLETGRPPRPQPGMQRMRLQVPAGRATTGRLATRLQQVELGLSHSVDSSSSSPGAKGKSAFSGGSSVSHANSSCCCATRSAMACAVPWYVVPGMACCNVSFSRTARST